MSNEQHWHSKEILVRKRAIAATATARENANEKNALVITRVVTQIIEGKEDTRHDGRLMEEDFEFAAIINMSIDRIRTRVIFS